MRKQIPKRPVQLATVANPAGRVDVALYRIAERFMHNLERDRGLAGVCENLLPIVEDAIIGAVPQGNIIPPEIQDDLRRLWQLFEQNRGRL